jgi:uncharacterized protein YegP (UPF0339 family)
MTFIIYEDRAGEWRWRTKRKGRITADSAEGYATKAGAKRAAESFWRAGHLSFFNVEVE